MTLHSWDHWLKPSGRLRPLLQVGLFILAIAAADVILRPSRHRQSVDIESVDGVLLLALLFSLVS